MGYKINRDERGIAGLAVIGIIVLVVAVAGVGYMVYSKNQKKDTVNQAAKELVVANAEAEKACKEFYKDDDLCKFVSNANYTTTSTKAVIVGRDTDGKTSYTVVETDKDGNTYSISKENDKEVGAFISLNGDTYVKDYSDNTWTKYPKSNEEPVESGKPENIADTIKEEENKSSEQRTIYKKIGKESCGNATCFKYQVIESEAPSRESFLWFDDKDYQLRKYSVKETDGSYNETTIEYTAVNIVAPSPVKEAPATPSAAEIQQQIQQAQESLGSEE